MQISSILWIAMDFVRIHGFVGHFPHYKNNNYYGLSKSILLPVKVNTFSMLWILKFQ